MCLSEVYTDEDMNRIVEGLPEVAPGVVMLQKIVEKKRDCFKIPFSNVYTHFKENQRSYKNGINIAEQILIDQIPKEKKVNVKYWSGFHFGHNPNLQIGVFPLVWSTRIIISCLVKKEWLKTAGKQWDETWFVASQAFFPTYPETEAKLEDFLAWLKENDLEWAESQVALIKSK